MPVCPHCGRNTPAGKFCEHCGALMPQNIPEPAFQVPVPQPGVIPPIPVKKGSASVKILVVIILVLGIFFAIGIYVTYSPEIIYPDPYPIYPTPTPTWYAPFDFNTKLPEASYEYQMFTLAKGDKVKVAVSTDGAPIDLLVMDSANFGIYENTNPTPDTVRYSGLRNIIKDDYTFVAPQLDTYYFVFDNSYWPKTGSNAKKNVAVNAVFSEYYQ